MTAPMHPPTGAPWKGAPPPLWCPSCAADLRADLTCPECQPTRPRVRERPSYEPLYWPPLEDESATVEPEPDPHRVLFACALVAVTTVLMIVAAVNGYAGGVALIVAGVGCIVYGVVERIKR